MSYSIKKILRILHGWLGLVSGIIVFFLGITGCLLAFQQEIESLQPYRHVAQQQKEYLPPSVIRETAESALPGKKIHSVKYGAENKSAIASFYGQDYYYLVFADPHTGKILHVKNMNADFFRIIIMGHYYLWLPPSIGQPIIASGTLIFLIMILTGIVLWWPRNGSAAKQRFKIKWRGSIQRRSYDLHSVIGFYISWVTIFIALTGLVWGFQWFADCVYKISSGGKKLVQYYEPLSIGKSNSKDTRWPTDQLWLNLFHEKQSSGSFEIHFPENDSSAITVALNPSEKTYWKTEYRYFDINTLQELNASHPFGKISKASAADKAMRLNYDIHTGAIAGIPGKILAFAGSLLAASLPVTGFLIWRNRKNKNRKISQTK